jgi:hypothetical protein
VLAVDQLTQSTNKSKRHCVAIKFYLNEWDWIMLWITRELWGLVRLLCEWRSPTFMLVFGCLHSVCNMRSYIKRPITGLVQYLNGHFVFWSRMVTGQPFKNRTNMSGFWMVY